MASFVSLLERMQQVRVSTPLDSNPKHGLDMLRVVTRVSAPPEASAIPQNGNSYSHSLCTGWLTVFAAVSIELVRQYDQNEASLMIRTRQEVCNDGSWTSSTCQGDERLRKIRLMLERGLCIERSPQQVMFHEAFLEACLPKIYGPVEWANHSMRVLAEFDIKKIQFEVMVITARRIGKSWSIAMFVVSLLLCVPGLRIAIFSTGSRASGSLYQIIMRMITEYPGAFSRVVKNAKEQLMVAARELPKGQGINSLLATKLRSSKDTAVLDSYPDEVKGSYTIHPPTYGVCVCAVHLLYDI